MNCFVVIGAAIMLFSSTGSAEPIVLSGNVGVDYRYFLESPKYAQQASQSTPELVFEPELELQLSEHSFSKYKGFYRVGSKEDRRNHGDIRELYWLYMGDTVDITLGIAKVFWGVTESRHLVDIINQSDLVEDIDEEQKLGQPMASVSLTKNWGTLSLYWLPYFRKREFPNESGRFFTGPITSVIKSRYTNGKHNGHKDVAVRYSTSLDDFDLGLSLFRGYGRQPWLLPSGDQTSLIATYSPMTQLGIDLQYTHDAFLWKLEAIANYNDFENFTSLVAGFEYTSYQIFESSADYGFLVEYLFSDKNQFTTDLFDNDIFIGGRLVLNNPQDTSLLVGIIIDGEQGESFIRLESKTRWKKNWTVELNSLFFLRAKKTLTSFKNDSYLEAKLRYHF